MANLSVLIHTFNGYSFLWDGCIQGWRANYNQEHPLYFGTDIEPENRDFWRFKVLKSGEGSWSDRLVQLLTQIDTKYVFYCQEDHWPVKTVPNLGQLMEYVYINDLLRLQIAENHRYYTTFERDNLHFFTQKSKYLVSHQPSIWDRKFFLEQIKYNEDPWLNEYEGTKRLNNENIEGRIAIYHEKWYYHACVRGKMV